MSEMSLDIFMHGIKENVRDAAVEDTVVQLKSPSGRNPKRKHVEQSEWFNSLSQRDQSMVISILHEAVNESLFGLFAILDGVRDINDNSDENYDGRFEVSYVDNKNNKLLLNSENDAYLHDVYNAITND